MSDLRFDGRVVVVTGAGAGLGRAYALLFASRGAKVIVNDLGGGRHGDGSSSKAADTVVEEIKRNGGTAVADYNSVVEGEKIVKTAIDNFGRIDVLINNAGILRDKSFAKISDQDWDLVHNVHLKGSFKATQAAFPYFKKQNYGRIIMTSSNSGIYGNFGQANYSAAKLGLVGLANTIAIEGAKNNVYCNVIVPTAASRLTEDILPPDVFAQLKPELIAPVVAYLCHESCQENGSIIESAAGWAGRCTIVRSNGALLRKNLADGVSLENVRDNWEAVRDISNAKRLENMQEVTMALVTSFTNEESGGNAEVSDVFNYCSKDTILYALGVGASVATKDELRYLYENHEDFSVLPTFFIMPAMQVLFTNPFGDIIPGKQVSLENILHGEQYIEIFGDVPLDGKLTSKSKVVDVLDKGSGAVIINDVETFDNNGNLICRNQIVSFAVGAGNFGGPRTSAKLVPCQDKPNRSPDASLSHKTNLDQAALYRLSGDYNPLHIDPNMAKVVGYDVPILHGLCTMGISVRLVLSAYASHDTSLFKAVKARFVKPVLPGQTLKVDMWREGNRIHFETSAVESNRIVIAGAYIDLKSVKPNESTTATLKSLSMSNLKSDAIFEFIIDQVKADPSKAKSVGGVFLYNITKDGKQVKQWTMDLKNAKVFEGKPEGKPNTTLTISDDDFMQMAEGKLNPQQAFMKGKLKVTGNIMLAQKLAPLLKTNAKL
ncbi:peroxisomal multifunctional enzyme type 2 isoform X1 [Diabrotica virgifera virgifera]|uniref:Ketoreductase domain-containing protein n=1 Tax=Diabrotica virgifera virgifera TaxID=50390 RepID=A0ABM5KW30_DIAVI|nr:peroxisomal multifunctional enzyme type 2 isoform X1 [Diabrotica virgifera virgifera]